MDTNDSSPPPLRADAIRELVGAAIGAAGAIAMDVAAFAFDWRAGLALLGAGMLAVGLRLITGEV